MSTKVKKPKRDLPQGVYADYRKNSIGYRVKILRNYEHFQGGIYDTVEAAVTAYNELDALLKQYEI